ncbi:MAG: ComEC/Rec2 family competence protein, partial [Defluviitaleaceae bacterium]|nr:ComEC/Rec2 family competence protein [Defluviitaleaceae bacterium]
MKRPIIGAMLFLIFGILIGQYSAGIVLFFALLAAAVTGCLYIKFRYWPVIFFIFFFVLGAFRISISVKPQDKLIEDAVHDRTEFIIKGVVQDTGTTSTGNPKCVLKTETVSFLNNSMQKISMNVNVYLKAGQIVNVGDVLILTGELQPLAVQRNPGGYNEFAVQRARGIEYKMFPETAETVGRKTTVYAVLNFVKMKMASVYDNVLPEKEASIMKSIILGDKAGLDGDVGDMYRSAGIYHLLCISGLHISILLAAIYFALGKLFNKRSAGIIALVIMIFYCIMTGSGISTVRAVTMCGIAVLGRVLFRDYDILNTVCLTCAALLIHQPLYLHDVGFQLSFGAVFGIAVLSDPFTRAISMTRLPLPNAAKEFFAVNFAATLTTYPILAYHFYHLASYSLIVNAIILPSAAFLVIVGFCVGLIGLVTINGAVFVSGAVYFLLKAYENICLFFVSLPGSVWLTGSVGIFVLIFAFCVLISAGYMFSGFKEDLRKRVKIFCSAIAAFIIAAVASSFNPGLTLTMLDAGQGDAFILQAQNRTFLIDAGGMKGDRVLLPFLDY